MCWHARCGASFGLRIRLALDESRRDSDDLKGVSRSAVRNEYERFDLWAVNLGLYQTGHGSLDYRLRDAEAIWAYAERLLLELHGSLQCSRLRPT